MSSSARSPLSSLVTAFAIGGLRRNTISITGEVMQPGLYEWRDSLTLRKLVEKAQGVAPWAMRDRVKVMRSEPLSGRREIYSVNLDDKSGADFVLGEFDEVTVLDGRLAYPTGTVLVEGAVNKPGRRPHARGLTLRDVIDLAGGFAERATGVEVARRVVRPGYTDTTSVIFPFALGANHDLTTSAEKFALERGDEISVRTTPGGRDFGSVTVRGLFSYPGAYAVRRDDERLLEMVKRAGGILPTASRETFRMIRDGHAVAISYDALMSGDREANIAVRPGDEILIDNDPAVVLVTGAVERHVAVPFRESWSLEDYLDAAGGVKAEGQRNKVLVEYAGGGIARTRKTLFWTTDPTVRPGSTITVAEKPPEKEGAWRDTLALTSQVVSVFGTLALAFAALRR